MILGFAHPAIVVTHLEKAVSFYTEMFGFELVDEERWEADNDMYNQGVGLTGSAATNCVLKGHNCFLELFLYEAPEARGPDPMTLGANEPGIRHLCFYSDDVRADFRRLVALGGIAMNEPAGNDEFGYCVYCRDPFGNIIELTEQGGSARHIRELPAVDDAQAYQP